MNGNNIVAGKYTQAGGEQFKALNPATGAYLDGDFYPADVAMADEALLQAATAYKTYKLLPGKRKAEFLRAIATELTAAGAELVERAVAESGLPVPRLQGELGRTAGQLRMFADLVEEGSWVEAVIDTALPDRTPLPRPDIRRMLTALGPVVVFGASNFPLAFSVAGGDTASALAAGCPVVVKVHPAHPGTSALAGAAIAKAAADTGMPEGVFSLLYDTGFSVGQQLVTHPLTKAVAFTGSFKGGMALINLANQRGAPIPVFTEMGSINPVVFLPEALNTRPEELAAKYAASITLGAGQFCTNPGLMLAVQSEGLNKFEQTLAAAIEAVPSATMLTNGIWQNYETLSGELENEEGVTVISASKAINSSCVNQSTAKVAKVSAADFIANKKLREEVFGPLSLLVVAESVEQLQQVAEVLEGQLTVTIMAEKSELASHTTLLDTLTSITGRIILNGVPTGVEVCAAMQHGGPFPAASDSRFTSVGTAAIYRFVRPVAWQDWDNQLLPAELQDGNPLNIWRKVNNDFTKA